MKAFFCKCRIIYIRLTHWEYWNSTIIYLPVIPYLAFLWLRARSVFFFNAANPGIEYGGFLMESKWKIHRTAPAGFFPDTVLIEPGLDFNKLKEIIPSTIIFPFIAKPDIGSKGRGVAIINNPEDLKKYHESCPVSYIIQQRIDYRNEAGIFYVRMPGESVGRITGIVQKKYIQVTGNGRSTLKELLEENPRYMLQVRSLGKILGDKEMSAIIAGGEIRTVIEIGNHARGAMFINASNKITPALITTIDNLCKKFDGFYYGRLDIKFEDWKSLEGGEKFGIVELNGAGSEPTHIYDPSNNILQAWKEICRHWKFLYNISKYNNGQGTAYLNWKEALIMFRNNALLNKKLIMFASI
ncbi:MAG: hypothetical protein ABIN89_25155 [Chitinophagaceae bacterium]